MSAECVGVLEGRMVLVRLGADDAVVVAFLSVVGECAGVTAPAGNWDVLDGARVATALAGVTAAATGVLLPPPSWPASPYERTNAAASVATDKAPTSSPPSASRSLRGPAGDCSSGLLILPDARRSR
ncbi:MAG: hypothetical protein ACE5FI_14160 [Anaerolineales bacterium]